MSEELKNVETSKVCDARGTACPGPMLAAKKAIADIQPGEVMEVLSSDEGTNKDIPVWTKKAGHEFMGTLEAEGYWRLFIKRVK